jgi:integrase
LRCQGLISFFLKRGVPPHERCCQCSQTRLPCRLKEANGYSNATVDSIEKAILLYEDFTNFADFATFNSEKAIEFKKWLQKKEPKGKTLSISSYCTYLRNLGKFFLFLSWQPGYKSKISFDTVDYLKPLEKEERIATQYIPRNFPLLEFVIKLTDSIKITSEIDKRDRAIIAFALLSGMRDKAICMSSAQVDKFF